MPAKKAGSGCLVPLGCPLVWLPILLVLSLLIGWIYTLMTPYSGRAAACARSYMKYCWRSDEPAREVNIQSVTKKGKNWWVVEGTHAPGLPEYMGGHAREYLAAQQLASQRFSLDVYRIPKGQTFYVRDSYSAPARLESGPAWIVMFPWQRGAVDRDQVQR